MTREELMTELQRDKQLDGERAKRQANMLEKKYYLTSVICPDRWIDLEGGRVKLTAWGGYNKVSTAGPDVGALAHEEGNSVAYIWTGEHWFELRGHSFGEELSIRDTGLRKVDDFKFVHAGSTTKDRRNNL